MLNVWNGLTLLAAQAQQVSTQVKETVSTAVGQLTTTTEQIAATAQQEADAVASEPTWFEDLVDTFQRCFVEDDRWKFMTDGLWITIKVSLVALFLGMILGFLIALCCLSKSKILRGIGKVYTDVIRGTPSVTQLVIIYFVVLAPLHWEKWIVASIEFAINSGAYVAEIIRGGILSVDKGQTEAGASLGLKGSQTMMYIVVPQAVKNIFPALGNEFITLIKETAIVGYIGLDDLQRGGEAIRTLTYEAFVPLITTAVVYFVMIKLLTLALDAFEKKLRKADKR